MTIYTSDYQRFTDYLVTAITFHTIIPESYIFGFIVLCVNLISNKETFNLVIRDRFSF